MQLTNAYRISASKKPTWDIRHPLNAELDELRAQADTLQTKLRDALNLLAEERRLARANEARAIAAELRARAAESRAVALSGEHGSLSQIMDAVSVAFDVTRGDLVSPRRARALSWPRQAAFFLARKYAKHLSLPQIGRQIGGRDHTTVLHGIKVVAVRRDPDFAAKLAKAEAIILGAGNG